MPTGSTPLDDFLDDAGSSTETGEMLQRVGLLGSLNGILLATGVLVFLAIVYRGRLGEIRIMLRIAGAAGLAALLGAAVEIAGVASISDASWSDALTSSPGSAPMMRLLAGVLIVLGLFEHTVPADGTRVDLDVVVDVGSVESNESEGDDDGGPGEVRWVPSSASAFGMGGVIVGVLSFAFDGHTVTEGPRAVHALVDVVHVTAASTWFGGIVALVVLAMIRGRSGTPLASLVVRFSSVATVALVAVALAGSGMSLMIVDGLGDYTGTDWGRVLLLKLGATGVAVAIGAYNHFAVVPAIAADPDGAAIARRARTAITIEALVLLFVAVATVFLVEASTT